jgi:O-antigen/teichoic acid export membrane protein
MEKMYHYFKERIGIDQPIFYGILGKLTQASSGFAILFFITFFFTKAEQGYYFTFGSIIAINVFFELGLGSIITQYVAHETVSLSCKSNCLVGPIEVLSRLSSLLRLVLKWFAVVSVLLFGVLVFVGFYFFSTFDNIENVNWKIPWILVAFSTSINLFVSPLLAFIEGLGKVNEIAKIRFFQQFSYTLFLILSFLFGFKLYSGGIALLLSATLISILIIYFFGEILNFILLQNDKWFVSYSKEIFPYQWKIAISWISGYFIFQLFNPVIFAYEGAIAAGRMGMTLAVINGITSISMTWMNTKIPLLSNLISSKNFTLLDALFFKTLKQVILVSFTVLTITFMAIFLMREYSIEVANRFVDNYSLLLLFMSSGIFIIINALAVYLRCHKKEPFLGLSLLMGILTSISTLILGRSFGVFGISLGYFIIVGILSFAISISIFVKKKKEWHASY